MPNTYTLIEKITVGAAGASSITFTSIPQTYTDLVIKWSGRDNQPGATANDCTINFNGSATSFSGRRLYGNGTSALSDTVAPYAGSDTGAGATTSTFSNNEIYIPNYTGSTNKSFSLDSVTERNGTEAYQLLYAGLWSNTAAITSISIVAPASYPFQQYSTFYLYGIAKEGVSPSPSSAPYATGGDSIVFDGTYWIHTFTSSGTFTPKKNLTCDYLVVAGGGSGGSFTGGGGGAGGLRSTVTATGGGGSLESALSLTANTGYTVTVGAGGAATTGETSGNTGSNSSISGSGITTVTSTGGGGGGTNGVVGKNGGSGGGGGYTKAGGTGTANQGYAGGTGGDAATNYPGAGGGGAGAVGGNATGATVGGNGGNGVAVSISGSSVTYAGGGGGGTFLGGTLGTGGTGGGGNAGVSGNGTANTGGGGGGSKDNGNLAGAGGSGIVIVRYAA